MTEITHTLPVDSYIEEQIALLIHLQQQIATYTDQADGIKDWMRTHLENGQHQYRTGTITLGAPTNRFDPAKATETLPVDVINACTEAVISPKKAKAILPPALYQQCCTPTGDRRLTIKATP